MNKFLLSGLLTTVLVFTLVVIPAPVAQASPGLVTADLDSGLNAEDLVDVLLGDGITVTSVSYTGANCAAGTFSGGTGTIGFEEGIVLSSGDVAIVVGPNDESGATRDNGNPGDAALDTLIPGYDTYDAAVLEFDFIPSTNLITFEYVFGSEEYNEYANTEFNDVFGFFLNQVNVALLPDNVTPVAINNVNCGNSGGDGGAIAQNSEYFIDNDPENSTPCYIGDDNLLETQLDGLTVVLQVVASVNPGVENHIKLAIADAGDYLLDSDVFIKAGSFVPYNPLNLNKTDGLGEGECLNPGDDITYTISYENTNPEPVNNVVVIDILPDNVEFVNADHTYTQDGQELTFDLGTLDDGESGSIEIVGTVNAAAAPGIILVNECTIESDETELTTFIEETLICSEPGPPPGPEVGGEIKPVNKLMLLVPFITMGILVVAAGSIIMLRRRKTQN